MSDARHEMLAWAANPRRATQADVTPLAKLFAAAFLADPVMDWIARSGAERPQGLEGFFHWLLAVRAIPFSEVWMADDASVCAVWLPPDVPASPGGLLEQISFLPMFIRLCGLSRLLRGQAMADAMEKNHPPARHYYLAFIAVAPQFQGMGLGSALMQATLKSVDASGVPAYLENSNPKNTRLYERCGFITQKNIAPAAAPPLVAMWRPAH
ncbi:MAG TPA: GNAT family N-acetyltransferase [Rhizomicrobium sp.]|jgi:ribosomal protein S18 acetylase RimI-like enzyme